MINEDTPKPDEAVAQAIYEDLAGEGEAAWTDIPEDERGSIAAAARAAVLAHVEWLREHGFKIIPPGTVAIPGSDEEAAAMMTAVAAYKGERDRKKALLTRPTLIVPPVLQ